jgi:hypothetical protein
MAVAAAVLVAGLLLALMVGRYPISFAELFSAIAGKLTGHAPAVPSTIDNVVWQVRGPRVASAALVGAALAIAGTAFQGLFRNPLVSPDILGASSGAALGAVLGIYFSLGVFAIQAFAFLGGLLAVAAVYAIGGAVRARDPILVLVLTGVVIGALLGAGVGMVKYLADPYGQLPAMTFWLLGSLASIGASDIAPLGGDRSAARRYHRCRNLGDVGERRDRGRHRLGRPGGAAHRAYVGRAGLRPAHSGHGAVGWRFSAAYRHASSHCIRGRNTTWYPYGPRRHAILHLAAGERVEDLVVRVPR